MRTEQIMKRSREENIAHNAGIVARVDGIPISANPKTTDHEREAWAGGWNYAQDTTHNLMPIK